MKKARRLSTGADLRRAWGVHFLLHFKLGVDGVAIAGVLHYNRLTVKDIKQHLINNGVEVRA